MNLETRMRQSIKRRLGTVLSRSDFASLGSQTQVTHALRLLVQKGELLRISRGIYAKAKRVADNAVVPLGSLDEIVHESASKLGLALHDEHLSFTSEVSNEDELIVETDTPRTSRKMVVHGKIIRFRSYRRKAKSNSIPTKGVASYVRELARHHNVTYTFNSMDRWANTVTRLAGDSVKQDRTEDLLVALKRAGKISKREVAILSVNYLREQKACVRSV